MERRQLLTRIGAVGGIGIGGAVVGERIVSGDRSGDEGDDGTTPDPRPIRHADEFGTVVDAVAAGVDPEGEVPINGFLERNAGDDTLLAFPKGTYRLEPVDLSGYTQFGVAAAHGERPRFVPTTGNCVENGRPYVQFGEVTDLLLDGLEFDFDTSGSGGLVRVAAVGDATIRNVAVSGSCEDQIALFRPEVLNPDATLRVQNVHVENAGDNTSLTGVYVGRDHAGTLEFRDCTVVGFSDNGLYASAPGLDSGRGGIVNVTGGRFGNNNIANVRLGSDGSTARGVASVSDRVPATDSAGPKVNVRGIRLRNGRDQLVTGCEVTLARNSGFSYGGIVFHPANAATTVKNTSVVVDRDATAALRAFPRETDGSGRLTFENVTVSGAAAHGEAALIDGRDGIHLRDSVDCRIENSRIDVSATPIVLQDATATIRNTTLVTPEGTRTVDELTATDDITPQANA